MNWHVYIKFQDREEELIATCAFLGDAELIFDDYKRAKTPCRIYYDGCGNELVYAGEEQ